MDLGTSLDLFKSFEKLLIRIFRFDFVNSGGAFELDRGAKWLITLSLTRLWYHVECKKRGEYEYEYFSYY